MAFKDKSKFNEYRNEWVRNRKRFFMEAKNVPCMDCGLVNPIVMEFDHRPDEVKSFTIAANWQFSMDRLLKEIAKCDIVCANCHRLRTHNRRAPLVEW